MIVNEQQYLGYLPAALPDDEIADAKETHWLRTNEQKCVAGRTPLVGADRAESTQLIALGAEHTGHSQAGSGSHPTRKDRRLGMVIDIADKAGLPVYTNPPNTLASNSRIDDPGGLIVVTGDVEEILSTLLLLEQVGFSDFFIECSQADAIIFECFASDSMSLL